jgi:hypothetical protein
MGSGLGEAVCNYDYSFSEITSTRRCELISLSSSGSWLSWFLLLSALLRSPLIWSGFCDLTCSQFSSGLTSALVFSDLTCSQFFSDVTFCSRTDYETPSGRVLFHVLANVPVAGLFVIGETTLVLAFTSVVTISYICAVSETWFHF